jgi:phytanoyl-CoA hydroxylase
MSQTAHDLGPDLAAAYRRDGYVVIPGLFPAARLAPVARDLAATFQARAQALGLDLPADIGQAAFSELLAGLFRRDIPAYMAAAKLTQHLGSVQALGLDPAMMAAVEGLGLSLPAVATRAVIHFMADRLKIPGGYQKTAPHQDWRSTQGSLDCVTIWAPLYDVGLADYPLEVIPGSHRDGLLEHEPDMPNWRVGDQLYDESAFQPLSLKAGDAVIFSGFLVHRTGERGGADVRVAFSFRFNNAAEPSFVARNYPNPYVYRADPAILTPDFPGAADLAPFFPDGSR